MILTRTNLDHTLEVLAFDSISKAECNLQIDNFAAAAASGSARLDRVVVAAGVNRDLPVGGLAATTFA